MIRNVIFDIGNTVMDVRYMDMLKKYKPNIFEMKTMASIMADSVEWDSWNKGLYKDVYEMIDILVKKFPKYQKLVSQVLSDDWSVYMKPDEKILKCITALKKAGYHVYFLADIPHEFYDAIEKRFTLFSTTDGGVFSFEEHTRKPDMKMYQALLDRYHLKAEECLYVDDNAKYLVPAQQLGMRTLKSDSNTVSEIMSILN